MPVLEGGCTHVQPLKTLLLLLVRTQLQRDDEDEQRASAEVPKQVPWYLGLVLVFAKDILLLLPHDELAPQAPDVDTSALVVPPCGVEHQ